MDKGKTFGGLGIGMVPSTVAGIFLAKKKKDNAKDLKSSMSFWRRTWSNL
jgi:hypothetical protein